MSILLHPATQRGHTQIDRLDSYHSFSFGEWYNSERMNFGALRVLNDDTIQGGSGFPPHPHLDMEIISIPLAGGLAHQDSMGHRTTITPDMIQVMSAGTGLAHAEYNAYQDQPTSFLQIWIQPRSRGVSPRHDEKLIELTDNQLSLLVHPDTSILSSGGLSIHQDAYIWRGKRNKSDTVTYTLQDHAHGVYLFVIAGQVVSAGQVLNPRDALAVTDQESIAIDVMSDTDLLIIEVPME